jgi:ubiquinone/menaquinone biosynthesis C-methylase UbiE
MNPVLHGLCPPLVLDYFRRLKVYLVKKKYKILKASNQVKSQDLDIYWDSKFADILENWGEDTTWNEIQLIMASCNGKVLDIACGTGKTIKILEKFKDIEIYGLDISDLLIKKAIQKGIPSKRLFVMSATETKYSESEFDYSYSIGSLEHFTEKGIEQFIKECSRYTKICTFHMVPVSRSGMNEGWIKTTQSFYNNSEIWWKEKFEIDFKQVVSIPSKWEDKISVGRWFICYK